MSQVKSEILAQQVLFKFEEVYSLYYRLILLVGLRRSGKTSVLNEVSEKLSAPLINVNLELSRVMLDLTERQRVLQVSKLLSEIVNKVAGEVVLLDNIEMLFHVQLKQNPLYLLQKLSRNKTIVAAWNGYVMKNCLIYATPEHSEYRSYSVENFLVVNANVK
ncbi:MAG TPA: BREX-3 system P-loop-containing protein BrxF [Desulfonauticus sp.]|nr:hypothetical protein [Desulfonauticus sp.]HCO12159.1 BREX-3 system P-loop-containing protein BrxF [Desulfonauticus sp.]